MMFSDDDIKDSIYMRQGYEIVSVQEELPHEKYDKKNLVYSNELLDSRDLDGRFRDGLFDGVERFAWTDVEGNIASLVSEPGFGTNTTFDRELETAIKSEMKEADTSTTSRNGLIFAWKKDNEQPSVSSTSIENPTESSDILLERKTKGACKVDKTDPRSSLHFVKCVKRQGRTVKLWECGICGRDFQHQYTLMRHLPTHTDERNFHCGLCSKSFRQLSTLSQHRAIHSTERPYACEVCTKTFNRVSTLISHRKTHSGEKPYKCHICPKGFHQKGNLRNHLFTHTNERPYRCNICMKGFNQQSNLVCHKNKAHTDDKNTNGGNRDRNITQNAVVNEKQADTRSSDHCEVSSSVGPYMPSEQSRIRPVSLSHLKPYPEAKDLWITENQYNTISNGVIVDPIKTYHMGVALAMKQTPFALLKSDNSTPVLVKVVDTALPGGKQMLVPATADDLRVGGKIIVKNDETPENESMADARVEPGAVQIRVPVVATVVPKIKAGGRLHLTVVEPHQAYHTALSTDGGEVKMKECVCNTHHPTADDSANSSAHVDSICRSSNNMDEQARPRSRMSPTFTLPPPAPSPPLDLISMELFEPMECLPMGPQIIAVDSIDQRPSDDSDIFIRKFQEIIPLSDSD